MNIKNVIFDLDGTLLDTTEGVLESVKYAVSQLGYDLLDQETMLEFVGPPIQESFMRFYGCDIDTAQNAANIFRDYYKDVALLKAEPYDNIFELCDILKSNGIKMAVATYKREDYAIKLLKHYNFDRYCNPIHGADNNNNLRKEDIVYLCLKEMGATNENSVLVGDTVHDANGAAKAKTPFIAVTYGFGFKTTKEAEQYENIGVASNTIDIARIILGEKI